MLSHGSEAGPLATKVSALAAVAEECGWRVTRPDFRDLDALGSATCVDPRLARMAEHAAPGERLVLGGSSMGAFVSGLASLQMSCDGLFLFALPPRIPGYARALDIADVPCRIVHGWDDAICPVDEVIAFARPRRLLLHLVRDDHRLGAHVPFLCALFRDFLRERDSA